MKIPFLGLILKGALTILLVKLLVHLIALGIQQTGPCQWK